MASRFEIIDEEYMEELKDEWKWKHEEKHGVLEESFQSVTSNPKLQWLGGDMVLIIKNVLLWSRLITPLTARTLKKPQCCL